MAPSEPLGRGLRCGRMPCPRDAGRLKPRVPLPPGPRRWLEGPFWKSDLQWTSSVSPRPESGRGEQNLGHARAAIEHDPDALNLLLEHHVEHARAPRQPECCDEEGDQRAEGHAVSCRRGTASGPRGCAAGHDYLVLWMRPPYGCRLHEA